MAGTAVLWLVCLPAYGQYRVNPARHPELIRLLTPEEGERKLSCDVAPIKPFLNFAFRYQAGFKVEMPLRQFIGEGNRLESLIRVSPKDGGEPTYFTSRSALPPVPPKLKQTLQWSGGYFAGEGRYAVDLVVVDQQERACRKHWEFSVEPPEKNSDIQVYPPPGKLSALVIDPWRARAANVGKEPSSPRRITVLLHAAPLFWRSSRLYMFDLVILLSGLSSVLEQLPAASIRLVVFNLDQQKVLFEQNDLDPSGFRQMLAELSKLDLGTIRMQTLERRGGHLDLLTRLLDGEAKAESRPDAVIFLGPLTWRADRAPREAMGALRESLPRLHYLQFRMAALGHPFPDVVQEYTKALAGKTHQVFRPQDLVKAIREVGQSLDKNPGS